MEKKIVLIHGFGEDHTIFEQQIERLKQEADVFAPDLPGSGINIHHIWKPEMESIEWLADWVKIQLDKHNLDKVIMLGHSMGGYITLAFAEKYPEKLSGFGLIHSTAMADAEEKKKTRQKAIEFMTEKGPFTFMKTAIPGLFGSRFQQENEGDIQHLINESKQFTLASLTAYYRAMIARPDRTQVLQNADSPVLIIAGTEDMAAPLQDLTKQSSMPDICHFHIYENCGHMSMLENSVQLSEDILGFIQSI